MAHEHPHDAFFKRVFARPDIAADLLRRRLPQAVIDALDLERLEMVKSDQRLHATQIVEAARSIDDAETKEVLMTLAEQFEQIGLRKGLEKGIERGRLTGRAEALLNQIHLKFGAPSADVIERVGAAGLSELDRWTARILSADSIDALFET